MGGGTDVQGDSCQGDSCPSTISTYIRDLFQLYLRERSSITSARLGGVGGLSQNADTADALEGGEGV